MSQTLSLAMCHPESLLALFLLLILSLLGPECVSGTTHPSLTRTLLRSPPVHAWHVHTHTHKHTHTQSQSHTHTQSDTIRHTHTHTHMHQVMNKISRQLEQQSAVLKTVLHHIAPRTEDNTVSRQKQTFAASATPAGVFPRMASPSPPMLHRTLSRSTGYVSLAFWRRRKLMSVQSLPW